MKILSITIINPGNDSQWWRINNIFNIIKSKHDIEIFHYIIKGSIYHKRLNNSEKKNKKINITSSIFIPFKIAKKIWEEDYDLIYGNTKEGVFFSVLGKLLGVPIIFDMHGIYEEIYMTKKIGIFNVHKIILNKLIEYIAIKFSNKILCVSNEMISYLNIKRKVPIEKMEYITNGVDLDFFKPIKNKKLITLKKNLNLSDKIVFGYIGQFQQWQGTENLLKAANSISNDNIKFLFVGGEEKKINEKIIYLPNIPRNELIYYYSLCDILILPRPHHVVTEVAAPTKFAEYAAIGKPILVTNVGDAAKLVKKYRNGIVIKNNDVNELKKGIMDFLSLDEQELINMGKKSRKLAENEFNWEIISKNLFKLIEEVVS